MKKSMSPTGRLSTPASTTLFRAAFSSGALKARCISAWSLNWRKTVVTARQENTHTVGRTKSQSKRNALNLPSVCATESSPLRPPGTSRVIVTKAKAIVP